MIRDWFTSGYNAAKKNRRIKLNQSNQTIQKYQSANIYIYIKYCIYTNILQYAFITLSTRHDRKPITVIGYYMMYSMIHDHDNHCDVTNLFNT